VIGAKKIPSEGGALLISNHVSYLDALLLGCCTHRFVRFLMWKPYFEIKLLNPFLKLFRAIPIDPVSPKQTLRALREACDELKSGELVGLFPEGALTRTGQVRTFQRGIERLIECSPGTLIVPVYLDGLAGHPWSANGPRTAWNWLCSWRRQVTISIGDPVSGPVSATDIRQRVIELESQAMGARKTPDSTLGHRLIVAARRNWSRPAIADSTKKQLKYGEMLTGAVLIRNWLSTEHKGEQNIGLLLPTSVGGAVANFGVTLAGRTAVNLNFTAGEENLRSAIEQCGIQTVITSRVFIERIGLSKWQEMVYLEGLLPRFTRLAKIRAFLTARFAPAQSIVSSAPDHIACIVFSSGSTGVPKGVELSHWNLVSNIDSVLNIFPLNSTDCMLGVLPLFHSFGYTFALWFPIIQQFRAVFHVNPTDAKTIGELAETHRPTFLVSTPTFSLQYARKCTREQFSSLKYVLVGAEKLRESVAEEFRSKFGIAPLAGYGCTEVGPGVAVNTPDVIDGDVVQEGTRRGSVGRPLPGVAVRVVDPQTFQPLRAGEQGMLLVNGPSRMVGYYGAPEKTREVLQGDYYVTGDLGYLDEDGFLYITDRLARFSKIGGEMVPHLKIEDALDDLLGNRPCFVTGVPDERRGERLAVLYTAPEVTPSEMVEHLNAVGLPPLWIPKRENFYLVEAVPTLGSGKVDLAKARALVLQRITAMAETLQN
jgi:acyl-[acyl-carrier-protein]-phospholipid O-acyltransferase / long-chain-fatty-acid--[acyl-carrier-protein] ligase